MGDGELNTGEIGTADGDGFYKYPRNPGLAPSAPFDMGNILPDEEPLPPGGFVSDGESNSGGDDDDDPEDGDFDTDDPFAIKINGSAPTVDEQGQPVYSSSFTITVNSGDVTFKGPNFVGGELAPVTLNLSPGISATFPVGDNTNKYYVVYAKVEFTRSGNVANGLINAAKSESRLYVEESTSHNMIEGWSDYDTTDPVWMVQLGTVAGQKRGINRYIFVNQIRVGNLVYGGGEGDPDGYAFKVIDNGDGSVSVLEGSVDSVDVAKYEPGGQPTGIWLMITTDSGTGNATAAAHQLSNPGAFTTTMCHVKVATISWDGNTPSITPGIRGNVTVAGCGQTYEIKSLY